MKKFVTLSALAAALLLATEQQASAWSKVNFSCGLNLNWVCSGNSFLWGAYRSSPLPGNPELAPMFNGNGGCFNGFNGSYGYSGDCGPYEYAQGQGAAAPTAVAGQPANIKAVDYQSMGYYGTGGYYPTADYNYYQAPSYWYGR
jgi:hypothetical protein